MIRSIAAVHESWPLAQVFRISRGSKTAADVVVVEIEEDGVRGRGEAVPYGANGLQSAVSRVRLSPGGQAASAAPGR